VSSSQSLADGVGAGADFLPGAASSTIAGCSPAWESGFENGTEQIPEPSREELAFCESIGDGNQKEVE